MDQQEIIVGLEERAKRIGLPMSEVCKRAGVHPTTFSRWKLSDRNPSPKGATIPMVGRLDAVISAAEASSTPSDSPKAA